MVGQKRAQQPEEEEAFPRGGQSLLTALEKRQINQQAQEDFEQEQKAQNGGQRKAKRTKVRWRLPAAARPWAGWS